MKDNKIKIISTAAILLALVFFAIGKARALNAPELKEGTYLTGQTLSVWPSWSLLGNALGRALPVDPINQLAPAGTCATHPNIFCTSDRNCPPISSGTTTPEKCVLHDPETGWSTADRRFSFACSQNSYAYRYIASTTPGVFTVRARFEDPGVPIVNLDTFISRFVSTSVFSLSDPAGVCNYDQEISTIQSGACGDGVLNTNKGEQCDPPGRTRYGACGERLANIVTIDVCNRSCQWVPSSTPYVPCSALSKCGNGLKESGEACDEGALNGKYNHCNTDCRGFGALGRCGDGAVQAVYEICDPGTPGVEQYSLTSRNDSCSWDCQNWGPYCGDGIIQAEHGEECDGSQACSVDGRSGVKICTNDCKMSPAATSTAAWLCAVASTASMLSAPGSCGDAVVGANEACDRGLANNGKECEPTYGKSCSYCAADCQNTIDVQPLQYCGNGIIENIEKCDADVKDGTIYSAAANITSTFSQKISFNNGYKERTCAEELTVPHTIKKGEKTCSSCANGVARGCVVCGQDKNGVSVAGSVINVLENPRTNANLDPLFTKTPKLVHGTSSSSLSLAIGEGCKVSDPLTFSDLLCIFNQNLSPVVAAATKTPFSSDLVSYTLRNPYGAGGTALINSNPLCSDGENINLKYRMIVNDDWVKPINFPVVSEPATWQYDLVLSPVVNKNIRPNDLRIVASWVGSGDFVSGVFNPAGVNNGVEGASYVHPFCLIAGQPCSFIYEYTAGVNYYDFTANSTLGVVFKKEGIWYHGLNSTPGQTSAESFTIDTSAMVGGTYSFFVRAPSFPIRTFKNTARLKVEIYLPEANNNPYSFGAPVKTYYFNSATPSDNQNARYWQVFNINKPSQNLSISDIIDVNAIATDLTRFQYISSVEPVVVVNTRPSATVGAVPIVSTAPTAPQNLRVTGVGDGYINLAWNPPAIDGGSAITGYKVYRTSSNSEISPPVSVAANQTTFNSPLLSNGTTYYYRVTAVNAIGESVVSNEVSATPQTTAMTAPVLSVAGVGSGYVDLSWNDPTNANAADYNIFRSTVSGGRGRTSIYIGPGTTYRDSAVVNGTTYYYVVQPVTGKTVGINSNEVSATPR